MKAAAHIKTVCFVLFILISTGRLVAQGCSSTTPHFTIDMTGSPDSIWTSTPVARDGQCCSTTAPDRCIHFTITLDINAQGVSVQVSGATGTTYYEVNCANSTLVGDTICLSGVGPHEVTICKPGNNLQTYTIASIPKPHVAEDSIWLNPSCQQQITVSGLNESTITWKSISNSSTYNAYLNCLSGCDTTTVTLPQSGFPAYVDYIVSGYNIRLACDTNKFQDTIRVFMFGSPSVSISPSGAYQCGSASATVTAIGSGGLPPYQYKWSDSGTSATRLLTSGTYWVRITDSLGCSYGYDTVTIVAASKPAAGISGSDSLCRYDTSVYSTTASSGKTYLWSCSTATVSGSSTLSSAAFIFGQPGIHTISLTVTDTATGCDSTVTKQVFADSVATISVLGNSIVCEGSSGEVYTVANNAGYSYSWSISGGNIASGGSTNTVTVDWPAAVNGSLQATVTKPPLGCTSSQTLAVTVTPLPVTSPINHH